MEKMEKNVVRTPDSVFLRDVVERLEDGETDNAQELLKEHIQEMEEEAGEKHTVGMMTIEQMIDDLREGKTIKCDSRRQKIAMFEGVNALQRIADALEKGAEI